MSDHLVRKIFFVGYRLVLCAVIIALLALPTQESKATTLPANFTETQIATGLSSPTAMEFAPDGRLFITQQGGAVRIIKNGALLSQAFVTLSVNSSGERGLLGIAFDPNFSTNNFVYLYYTTSSSPIHNRISRFTANGDVAVAGSEVVIVDLENLTSATNHNGGAIHFGPDGKLYVGVGENATSSNAQTLNNRLGKILRINSDGTIPTDNPFFNTATGVNRSIWALGLRNPFTFAFQPGTGRMHINDVGQNTWEEINLGVAGANYGWPTTEGPTTNPSFNSPIYAYQQNAGTPQGCAITGGAFYNPASPTFPTSYIGDYFFMDYCGNWIYSYDIASNTATSFASATATLPVDIKLGPDAALYYVARGTGSGTGAVFRIQFAGTATPTRTRTPTVIGPTNTPTRTRTATPTSTNQAPTGTITAPVANTRYNAGTTINFAGTATDPEDGTLPASAYEWEVVFHHETHTHPHMAPVTGVTSGSFNIPNQGETSSDVWYRLYLRVRDSGGRVHESFRDILPNTASITVQSNPGGLTVKVDGQPFASPHTFTAVVGMQQNISVDSPQTSGATTYTFTSWSDSGAISHNITIPATNTTYTANFTGTGSNDGAPFNGTPAALPGTVQAENFNTGGQGVAYNDTTTANQGNQYRTTEAVDIETTTDTGTGYNVGWTAAGEWMKYTVNVQSAGTYTLSFRVAASAAGGSFHLEVDGTNVTGTMTVPGTGGWQTWTTITRTGVSLTAGQHVLRFVTDTAGFNLNWFSVTGSVVTNTPFGSTPTRTPTRSNTPGATVTRTNTPNVTPTRTPTTIPGTATRTATPVTSSSLKVQYRAADTNATDNQIKPHFNVVNTGSSAVALSDLKIRYYFTREGTTALAAACDWSQVGCANVTTTFVNTSGTNWYLEVGFTGTGTIPANGQTGDIQIRMNKSDWSNFNEADDYSFDATKTAFADWTRVTLYRAGTLVWGVVP